MDLVIIRTDSTTSIGVLVIRVTDGDSQHTFYLSEILVKKRAPKYYKELLAAHELGNDIELDTYTFQMFANYVADDYNFFLEEGALPLLEAHEFAMAHSIVGVRKELFDALINSVKFGDDHGDTFYLDKDDVDYVYTNTEPGSILRRLCVTAFFYWQSKWEKVTEYATTFQDELLEGLKQNLWNLKEWADKNMEKLCTESDNRME